MEKCGATFVLQMAPASIIVSWSFRPAYAVCMLSADGVCPGEAQGPVWARLPQAARAAECSALCIAAQFCCAPSHDILRMRQRCCPWHPASPRSLLRQAIAFRRDH
eukprot:2904328-Pyramimonas_sp.AAC.1